MRRGIEMSGIDRVKSARGKQSELAEKVRELIMQEGDPARVLELYYWCQEPGLLNCIRAIIAMPDESRAVLQAFLSDAAADKAVTASLDSSGSLNIRSPDADKAARSASDHPSRLQS
jgi:hypothetical protein